MLLWHYELQYLTGKFLTFYMQKDACLSIRQNGAGLVEQ